MTKNIIIVGVVLVVVVAGIVYIMQQGGVYNSVALEAEVVSDNVVVYTNNGYSPNILQVNVGDTVICKNESSRVMWPASAIHPVHTAYPTTGGCIGSTFDACGELSGQSTWSFQFDEAGSWKYHDHKAPQMRGTIVVQ